MKNILKLLITVMSVCFTSSLYAFNFGNIFIGPLFIQSTVQVQSMKVLGPVRSIDSTFNGNLNIMGPMEAINSTINNDSEILGDIRFINSIATKKISTKGRTSQFLERSRLTELFLIEPDFGSQTVILDNSIISGNITFEKRGLVILKNNGKILGQVINGSIKYN